MSRKSILPHRLFPTFVCLWAWLPLAGTASADDLLTRGAELQRRGQLDELHRLFAEGAAADDPQGAFGLGVLYFQGIGVEKDLARSADWFHKAAEQGYVPAQYNLGNAFLRGEGIERNLASAAHWWRRAAGKGYARAQFNLGVLLLDSAGDSDLKEEGIAWLRAAARQGFAKAHGKLLDIGEPVRLEDIAADPDREPARGEGRLLTLPKDGFCIQLFSGKRPGSAERFVTTHRLQGSAMRFRFPVRGEPWTGVCHGWYPDREAARGVLNGMKRELLAGGPWIRRVAEIQKQILAARELRGVSTPGLSEGPEF